MTHTPGPWVRIVSPKHKGAVFFKEQDGYPFRGPDKERSSNFVCKVYPDHDDDAHLIEAALALLEAAEIVLPMHEAAAEALPDKHGDEHRLAVIALRAAIALAKGEQP